MWTELQNLKESNEFLNLLLDNMNSAVLIADENLKIHQFFYINGQPVERHFQFSTRPIKFQGRKMFLIIIYDVTEIELQTGDKILLYTDGLIENRNSAGAYFGKQRFYDIVKKHGNESVQKIVETVYATVKEFGQQAKPDDDISILGVEYCG